MAKFSKTLPRPPKGATRTLAKGATVTYEGGTGFEKDPKTALYTLAVTNMVSEPTFYESGQTRDERFINLVHQVTAEDPTWVQGLLPWLRQTANMRTSPLVGALEYGAAGGPDARKIVASVMQRPDEPAEALGYWLNRHGRKMPMAVKRGIADAVVRLYNGKAALKYDGGSRGVRMGDVIEYVHPNPKSATDGRVEDRNALYRYLLDRRHGRSEVDVTGLKTIGKALELEAIPVDERRETLRSFGAEGLADAGFTWERLSGWLPGGMDAEAWEAIIPSMGYMALLRNLRNFEAAKVDEGTLKLVAERIADPEQVAKSRQFPYRFYSAYANSGTTFFAHALEQALQASLANVPVFPGRTLVLVDTSASMAQPVSARSVIRLADIAALFGTAVAANGKVDFGIYATGYKRIPHLPLSVLRSVELVHNSIGNVGHGTNTWPAVEGLYDGHDRIVVFTDMQDHPANAGRLPAVPVYVWDVAGYANANLDLNQPNRYLFSGFTDTAFRLIALLEAGNDAGWPWED